MPQVIVDPTELRRFAQFLLEIANEIHNKKAVTSHKLDDLKKVWRDARFHEFEPAYANATREIDRFVKAAHAYSRYL